MEKIVFLYCNVEIGLVTFKARKNQICLGLYLLYIGDKRVESKSIHISM